MGYHVRKGHDSIIPEKAAEIGDQRDKFRKLGRGYQEERLALGASKKDCASRGMQGGANRAEPRNNISRGKTVRKHNPEPRSEVSNGGEIAQYGTQ